MDHRMDPQTVTAPDCCTELARRSELDRRSFLARSAAVGGGVLATQVFGEALMQSSTAATTGGNVLVVLSMRGGVDGLGVVVPHGDPALATVRPSTAVPTESLIARDAMFGLHPKLSPLLPFWNSGQLAAIQAVGLPAPNRSHFLAMEAVEDADPGSSVRTGWINRMVGLDATTSPVEAVQIGTMMPTSLYGPRPTMSTSDPGKMMVTHAKEGLARYGSLDRAWAGVAGPLGTAVKQAVQVSRTAGARVAATPATTAAYSTAWPGTDLADALKSAVRLIRANVGTNVITIDFGGWDLHSNYGTVSAGYMQRQLGAFAANLAAFLTDLGSLRSRVTVVTISEFGRRVAENGNRGFDHGWGNMMLVAGGGVKGGRYYGQWPGLAAGNLVSGDLKVTTDYRDVLGEVLARRFPDRSLGSVFPGFQANPLGFMA